MKKKAPLTLSSREDHQRRFPGSPDGSWWQDADRDRFTARAESELPRMRLAKFWAELPDLQRGQSEASRGETITGGRDLT